MHASRDRIHATTVRHAADQLRVNLLSSGGLVSVRRVEVALAVRIHGDLPAAKAPRLPGGGQRSVAPFPVQTQQLPEADAALFGRATPRRRRLVPKIVDTHED